MPEEGSGGNFWKVLCIKHTSQNIMTIGTSAQQIYYRTKSVIHGDYMFRRVS